MARKDVSKSGRGGERVLQGRVVPSTKTCPTCNGAKKVTQLPPRQGGVVDVRKAKRVDCPTCKGKGEVPNR